MDIGEGREDVAEPSTPGHAYSAPPSYEAVSARRSNDSLYDKPTRGVARGPVGSTPPLPLSNPSPLEHAKSSPFVSWRASREVRQTVSTLIRDLVLNADSPNLLDSCANACLTYHLDLSTLLQEPSIERRSAVYWAIVKGREALLPSLLAHAGPLWGSTLDEIRAACLVVGNQRLFHSLRCGRKSKLTPLSACRGADALLLGATPADEVSIQEVDGQRGFTAEMRINLWQKRLRVSGTVSVEFIARGRLWRLAFHSPRSSVFGLWDVSLTLQRPSPPAFVDSTLIIEPQTPSLNLSALTANAPRASGLISLSPPPDDPGRPLASSPQKSKTPRTIELRLSSACLLWWDDDDDDDDDYTEAIVVPLDKGPGEELSYDNTPFVATDGTLHARLEARLEKPSDSRKGSVESVESSSQRAASLE